MTTRATARQQLLDALDPLGFRDGRIDLPLLWPAVKAWLLDPATDVEPNGDERTFYLSNAPADDILSFAGTPPAAVSGRDLICIELGREFHMRDGNRSLRLGGAGLVLWYADGPAWEPLAAERGWIDAGPTTPHIDAFAHGDDTPRLTRFVEDSLAFTVASQQPALVAEITDGVVDNLVVLAAE
jgi:hypothetical protein